VTNAHRIPEGILELAAIERRSWAPKLTKLRSSGVPLNTNDILTPDVIGARALATFYNSTTFLPLVYRDFDTEFSGKQGDTITIRKPATFEAKEFDRSAGIVIQNAEETGLPVKLDTLADVSFAVTGEEMLLDIENFGEQFLTPAMEAHAQKVDGDIAAMLQAAAVAGGPTTAVAVATTDVVTATGHRFRNGDRVWFPTLTGGGAGLTALRPYYVINAVKEVSFKVSATEGGAAVDVTTAYTGGTVAEAGGGTVTPDANKGVPTALINGRTALGTNKFPGSNRHGAYSPEVAGEFLKDPLFGQVNTSGSTDALVEASIGRKYGIDNYETDRFSGLDEGIVFHQQAVAFVTRPLPLPMGSKTASIVSFKGLGLRVVYGWDQTHKQDVVSIDMLSGVQALRPAGAVALDLS
jgi:hypothetical protein